MTVTAEHIASLEEYTYTDVLPLKLDDGTRITCIAIAGGKVSTDGKPDHLLLRFTDPDHGDQTVRYYSEKVCGLLSDQGDAVAKLHDELALTRKTLATANETIRHLLDAPDDLEARVLALMQATVIDLLKTEGQEDRLINTGVLADYLLVRSSLRWEEKIRHGIDSIERRLERTLQAIGEQQQEAKATRRKPPARSKKTVGKKKR